jgi:hypothetical protein
MGAVLELWWVKPRPNFWLGEKKNLTTIAYFSNMPTKRKTSPQLIENDLVRKGRPSRGYTIHDAVKMVSHSSTKGC